MLVLRIKNSSSYLCFVSMLVSETKRFSSYSKFSSLFVLMMVLIQSKSSQSFRMVDNYQNEQPKGSAYKCFFQFHLISFDKLGLFPLAIELLYRLIQNFPLERKQILYLTCLVKLIISTALNLLGQLRCVEHPRFDHICIYGQIVDGVLIL